MTLLLRFCRAIDTSKPWGVMNSAVWEGDMPVLGQWELVWHRDVLLRLTAAAQLSNVSRLTSRGTWFSWKWSRGNVRVRQMYSDDVSSWSKELQDFHDREYKYLFFFTVKYAIYCRCLFSMEACFRHKKVIATFLRISQFWLFFSGLRDTNSQLTVVKSELRVCRIASLYITILRREVRIGRYKLAAARRKVRILREKRFHSTP